MIQFTADAVVVDDSDDEFILVGFADELDGEYREAIHFQRSYVFDEQDVALGMDQIYIERGIQAGSGYGGIEAVELHADRVRVLVSGRTAESLGDCEFDIRFQISSAELQRLKEGLRKVFAGFGGLRERVT